VTHGKHSKRRRNEDEMQTLFQRLVYCCKRAVSGAERAQKHNRRSQPCLSQHSPDTLDHLLSNIQRTSQSRLFHMTAKRLVSKVSTNSAERSGKFLACLLPGCQKLDPWGTALSRSLMWRRARTSESNAGQPAILVVLALCFHCDPTGTTTTTITQAGE